jgi:hypothetical protein
MFQVAIETGMGDPAAGAGQCQADAGDASRGMRRIHSAGLVDPEAAVSWRAATSG